MAAGTAGGIVKERIALVDDDRNLLASVSMLLEAEGFAVRCFTDGASALQGLGADPVDLAVLDVKMPRMDGMELLQRLRKRSDVPVVFLTSKDDEVDEVLGLRMGADDYIKKPFSQRLLLERIRTVLRRHRKGAAGPGEAGADAALERGELTLDHFLLALLEVGSEQVIEVLASLGVTAERVRAEMPQLGTDM